jgi:hypothetical protein
LYSLRQFQLALKLPRQCCDRRGQNKPARQEKRLKPDNLSGAGELNQYVWVVYFHQADTASTVSALYSTDGIEAKEYRLIDQEFLLTFQKPIVNALDLSPYPEHVAASISVNLLLASSRRIGPDTRRNLRHVVPVHRDFHTQ